MNTILITGSSSGIGRAAVKYFSEKNWNVAATMRNPENETDLLKLKNVKCFKLDVLDNIAIINTINSVIETFGKIDVIVNNAGYAAMGAFECASEHQIKKQFDVNVFGLMNVTKAILPHFRSQKSGTIINIASIAGFAGFPSFSLYNATKFAVEGFSEALQYELRQFNIKVKVIEPGPINTDFYGRSMDLLEDKKLADYNSYINKVIEYMKKTGGKGPRPEIVAKKIFKAANSNNYKLRYPVNFYAKMIIKLRKEFPDRLFGWIIRKMI